MTSKHKRDMIAQYMTNKMEEYKCSDYEKSYVRAQLAQLRKGVGKQPGDMPELWGTLFSEMPEELMSKNGEPTSGEEAIYIALTTYAWHQQGKDMREQNMHKQGISLGQALAGLASEDADDKERIGKRLKMFATASNINVAARHLLGLVSLLNSENIGMDYARLAVDLYGLQDKDDAHKVRLIWGQDFYRKSTIEEKGIE